MGLSAALVASLAATAVTTAVSIDQANTASDKQDEIQDQKQALSSAQARDDRRRQTREARIRQAQVQQGAENTGTGGSSGEGGALGVIATNLGENLSTIGSNERAGKEISANVQAVSDANRNIQTVQAVGGFASSIFSAAGNSSLFKQAPTVNQPQGPTSIFNYQKGTGGG